MVICPVAIAVGCRKCPIFKVCPVKSVIGDYRPPAATPATPAAPQRAAAKAKASPRRSRSAKARGPRK